MLVKVATVLGLLIFLCTHPSTAQTIKIGYTSRTLTNYVTLAVSERQNFYETEGLKVEHVLTGSATVNLQALIANEIQLSATSPDLTIIANNTKGTNFKAVAGICNGAPFLLIGAKSYKTVSDLKGARLGVSSLKGGATTFLLEYLRTKGLTYPRDFSLSVISGGTPARLAALEKGAVAAAVLGNPVSDRALEMGLNNLGEVVEVIPNFQFTALIADSNWAAKNQGLLVRLLKAHVRSTQWIYAHPEETAKIMSEALRLDMKYARQGIDYFLRRKLIPVDGSVTIEGLKFNLKSMINDGVLKEPYPSVDDVADLRYLRTAQAALK